MPRPRPGTPGHPDPEQHRSPTIPVSSLPGAVPSIDDPRSGDDAPSASHPRPVHDQRAAVDGGDALVVRVDRAGADLDTGRTTLRATWGAPLLVAMAGDPEAVPCTGDTVRWLQWPDERLTVEAVAPRRTLLARGQASGTSRRQLLAANVDVVAVVEGLVPDPDRRRIERLLSLAWASGARPVLLLTKCDLAPDAEALSAELAGIALSCAVHRVSSLTGEGLDEVRALLRSGRTMAMLGSSGVGKSSLLNALAAADVMRVRALRADGKGRHTTVTRELHRVCGGAVIDCPGVRAVALDDGEGVDGVFPEIADLARACRFSDCAHAGEPGCAVDEAVQEGSLDPDRLDSWRSLRAEGRRQELRRDARLRAEERRRRRVWAKSVRDLPSRPQTR